MERNLGKFEKHFWVPNLCHCCAWACGYTVVTKTQSLLMVWLGQRHTTNTITCNDTIFSQIILEQCNLNLMSSLKGRDSHFSFCSQYLAHSNCLILAWTKWIEVCEVLWEYSWCSRNLKWKTEEGNGDLTHLSLKGEFGEYKKREGIVWAEDMLRAMRGSLCFPCCHKEKQCVLCLRDVV